MGQQWTLDMSKAFDMVQWSSLFEDLIARKVDCLFLRLILFIYTNQQCDVKWNGQYSDNFSVTNGVRQGGVSSGIFFAIYIDKLLAILRRSGLGCHINGIFYGAVIFADDIFLLSASRGGLQAMVDLCANFVSDRNLTFGTNINPQKSKTKCIVFSKRSRINANVLNIRLNANELPWVPHVKHLGHILQSDNRMTMDIAQKRGNFIAKMNSLLQEFHFVKSDVLIKLMNTYATSIYGSNIWDIFSKDCEKLYTSFNVALRQILMVDKCTHRYLLEELSECMHLKTMLAGRYVNFYRSLVESAKMPVRFLARISERDQRTVLGRTLSKLLAYASIDDLSMLTATCVKKSLKYWPVPNEQRWRVPLCKELNNIVQGSMDLPGFSVDECHQLLQLVCTT